MRLGTYFEIWRTINALCLTRQQEDPDSPCSQGLAGANQDLPTLYDRLVSSYRDGKFSKDLKIPHHRIAPTR
jgi:hypothetical protein